MKRFIQLSAIGIIGVMMTACGGGGGGGSSEPTSVTHNGTTYGFVTSPLTGKVWLDKNLGAARVCETFNDTACYGDYYQWGRNFDGHQDSTSGITTVLAANVHNTGTSEFIVGAPDWATVDAAGTTRRANWSKTDGTSVCPIGFRVPSIAEIEAETLDAGLADRTDAFNTFLKLPAAGYRDPVMNDQGVQGVLWSSSVVGSPGAHMLYFDSTDADRAGVIRSYGFSVRCIKN